MAITIDRAHELLGHSNERSTRSTAAHLEIEVVGTMSRCGHCAAAKAKQSNVNKNSDHLVASRNGQKSFGDTAIVKKPKLFDVTIATPNWWMMVD